MSIEFAIKILQIQLQFKDLVFLSWSQSVTVSLFHVRHAVNYDDDDDDNDDDDDDDDNDDDDDDDNDDDDDDDNDDDDDDDNDDDDDDDDENDDDDDDDDNDDDDNDDGDDGKNSTYESFLTSNSHEVQTIKFHSLSSSPQTFFHGTATASFVIEASRSYSETPYVGGLFGERSVRCRFLYI